MGRPFLTTLVLLTAAVLLVAAQLTRRAASAAAPTPLPAATHGPPQAASAASPAEVWFEPAKPRRTRVAIRVSAPGMGEAYIPNGAPEWIRLTHEMPPSTTLPCMLDGLGPVLVLRHYLAEKQWASLTAPGGKGPVLVRYEIIDAWSLLPPYPPSEWSDEKVDQYLVAAVLYWADLAPEDRAAPLASYLTLRTGPSGEPASTLIAGGGPRMTRVRAQWMEYQISSKGTRVQEFQGRRRLAFGEAGWTIDEQPRLRGEGTSQCGQTDNIVPVYDLSISRPIL